MHHYHKKQFIRKRRDEASPELTGDRLHVALFRERIFLHEPVHTFPDYESEDPCCNLVVRKSKVVGRDARSDRKLPL